MNIISSSRQLHKLVPMATDLIHIVIDSSSKKSVCTLSVDIKGKWNPPFFAPRRSIWIVWTLRITKPLPLCAKVMYFNSVDIWNKWTSISLSSKMIYLTQYWHLRYLDPHLIAPGWSELLLVFTFSVIIFLISSLSWLSCSFISPSFWLESDPSFISLVSLLFFSHSNSNRSRMDYRDESSGWWDQTSLIIQVSPKLTDRI